MTVRLAQHAMNKNACQNQPQFNFLVGILPPVIFRSLAVLAMLAWATPAAHAQSISIQVSGYNDVPLTQTATTGSVSRPSPTIRDIRVILATAEPVQGRGGRG